LFQYTFINPILERTMKIVEFMGIISILMQPLLTKIPKSNFKNISRETQVAPHPIPLSLVIFV
jgi:hypothetical protein